MNRSLPRGDCRRRIPDPRRPSRRGRAVPGTGGLVGGVAAVASEPRVGHCCATFGPRWIARRRLGVSAKAAVTRPWHAGIETRSRKARRGRSRGGPGREGGA
jgi:hypothetical protein